LTSLSVAVTGYTTNRNLKSISFAFTTKSGSAPGNVTLDLTSPAKVWFQGNASQNLGGQFNLDIPFTFTGSAMDLTSIVNTIAVTVTNDLGASSVATVTVP